MYTLTLTSDERKAFDFIGGRYATGDDISDLLIEVMGEDEEWDQAGDIAFRVPEHIAWRIEDLAEQEDNVWPLFADELRSKMQAFVDSIV